MDALYQLTDQHQRALATLSESGLDQETIDDTLEGLEGAITAKCESVAMWRENQLVVASAKKEAAKRLTAQAKAIEDKANGMINYLETNMRKSNITEISCEYFIIKFQANPGSVNILDESLVPDRFKKVTTTESIDKNAVKSAINGGESVDGAELVKGERLVIK